MSLTAIGWICLYVALAVASLRRPVWALVLYLLTFFLSPALWWWGGPLVEFSDRINLLTALYFAAITFLHWGKLSKEPWTRGTLLTLLLFYALNATFVHFMFAANPPKSLASMTMIWKQVGLLFLLTVVVQSRADLNVFVAALLMGCMYIGFEVVVNERGGIHGGRLEGVGAPGAREANYLAGLMAFAVPLGGYWLLCGKLWQKVVALPSMVLTLEVIARCNSRGTFLALIASGVWLVVFSPGRSRRYALMGLLLACARTAFSGQGRKDPRAVWFDLCFREGTRCVRAGADRLLGLCRDG